MATIKKNDFEVSKKFAGKRLDLFLASSLESYSRSQIQKLIKENKVRVNGKEAKSSCEVCCGDIVSVFSCDEKKEQKIFQKKIAIPLVYEDDDIIIVDKPPGLVTHPGAGREQESLVHAFFNRLYKNSLERPGVVHRLDKDTQGLIVLAKNKMSYENLVEQFKKRSIKRTYNALCLGVFKEMAGKIETNLARNPKNRKKFSSQQSGKRAVTHYTVLHSGPVSLVELRLETGRTHQIRVHLSEQGHPILHDSIYSSSKIINSISDPFLRAQAKKLKSLALIALKLELNHPVSNNKLTFVRKLPKGFEAFCEKK